MKDDKSGPSGQAESIISHLIHWGRVPRLPSHWASAISEAGLEEPVWAPGSPGMMGGGRAVRPAGNQGCPPNPRSKGERGQGGEGHKVDMGEAQTAHSLGQNPCSWFL